MTSRAGVLVAAKPAGVTSFDVVAAARRALGVRRVGHAGTLDPDGTGVLPILIGEATKLMPYLADQDKTYRVVVRFGVVTDTLDLAGRVLETRPVGPLDRATVERAAARFVGRITQVPPMYSAVHHEGRRLYELAREGVEVDRAPRAVTVHRIDVDEVRDDRATLSVVCGKGTYVRVLAADLGEALGVGASVERLERTRVGPFTLDDAVSWDAIVGGDADRLWERVRPPEAAVATWPAVELDDAAARAFVHGQAVDFQLGGPDMAPQTRQAKGATPPSDSPGQRSERPGGPVTLLVRVHDRTGRLLGVGGSAGDRVRPIRILHVDHPGTGVLPA
jgi:tRNA pseudouridine55 synthase